MPTNDQTDTPAQGQASAYNDLNQRKPEEARNDPRSTAELIQLALSQDENDDDYWETLFILYYRATHDIVEAARLLCQSPLPQERSLGAALLGQLGIPERAFPAESLEILCDLIKRENDPKVLETALFSLGHLPDPQTIDVRLQFKRHPNADVRFAVTQGFAACKDPRAIQALVELSTDENSDVRDWATFGLGSQIETDTPTIREALLQRLTDTDNDTRGEALVGLALRKDMRVLEALMAELERADVGSLAVEAAETLADPCRCPALRRLQADCPTDTQIAAALSACGCLVSSSAVGELIGA